MTIYHFKLITHKIKKNMADFRGLAYNIIDWAQEKGILNKGTSLAQVSKTEEEVAELREALFMKSNNISNYMNSKDSYVNTEEEIVDGLGDCFVTLIIQCEMQGISPEYAIKKAYNVIKNRTGKMQDGQFIKD